MKIDQIEKPNSLIGTWKGTYSYERNNFLPNEQFEDGSFVVKINHIDESSFTGTVEEELVADGEVDIGKVLGTFTETEVKFKKLLPRHTMFDENGNLVIDNLTKHPTLYYTGKLSMDKKRISGTWRFKKKVIWKWFVPYYFNLGNGRVYPKFCVWG